MDFAFSYDSVLCTILLSEGLGGKHVKALKLVTD